MNSRPKKTARLLGLSALFMFLSILFILVLLPDPSGLVKRPVTHSDTHTVAAVPHVALAPVPPIQLAHQRAQAIDPYPPGAQHRDEVVNAYLIDRSLESGHEPNPCKYLDRVRELKGLKGTIRNKIVDVAEGRDPGDPYVELVMIPIQQILLQTRLGDVLVMLKSLSVQGNMSLAQKATAYSLFGLGIADLLRKKKEFELRLDQSYLTFSLLGLLREHPELNIGTTTQKLCERLIGQSFNHEESKEEFEAFVRSNGIDFSSFGYNPKYKSNLMYEKKGPFEYKGGGSWLDVFKLL